MRSTRLTIGLTLLLLGSTITAQTLYVEMQVRGTEGFSPRESDFIRATTDGLLETLWDAGYIVFDSGDPAAAQREGYLPNLLESARQGGAQLLLVVELETDRVGAQAPLTPRSFRYRLISVERGVPVESGTAAVAGLVDGDEVYRESYWITLGGAVGREVLNAH
mgnify:CR=1 FL=1